MLQAYVGAASLYPRLTVGADNVWAVIGYLLQRGSGRIPHDTATIFGSVSFFQLGLIAFSAFLIALLITVGWALRQGAESSRRTILILFAAGLLYFGFFMLPTQMHERYVFPALAFFLIPAVHSTRIRPGYLILSGTTFLSFVLIEPPVEVFVSGIATVIEPWKISLLNASVNCVLLLTLAAILASEAARGRLKTKTSAQ